MRVKLTGISHYLKSAVTLALTLVLGLGSSLSPAIAGTDQAQLLQHYAAGVKAYRTGDLAEAIHHLRQATTLDATHTNARYYLAIALDKSNRGSDAIAHYRYVVAHGSDARVVQYAQNRLNALQSGQTTTLIASAAPFNPKAAILSSSVSQVVVPLKNSRNALMVDTTLFNETARAQATGTFIIDTGATYTSISEEMAEMLGLDLSRCEKVRITTANGRIEVPKVVIDRLNVNGLEARNVEATVIPIRHGSSFSGLLGLSFIRQFVLTIDPGSGQLIFQQN